MDVKLTFDFLPVAGVLLTVLAWYVPGFKTWFEALNAQHKQLFMAAVLFIATAAVALLSGFGFLSVYPTTQGWQGLVWYPLVDFIIALVANAGVYKATNYMLGKGD